MRLITKALILSFILISNSYADGISEKIGNLIEITKHIRSKTYSLDPKLLNKNNKSLTSLKK